MIVETVARQVWTVQAVRLEDGSCPLLVELQVIPGRDESDRYGAFALLDVVAEHGPSALPSNICHRIDGPIWQFRKATRRVLWFYDEGKVVVCTHCFIKTTKKTPKPEIRRAMREYERYVDARRNGTLETIDDME